MKSYSPDFPAVPFCLQIWNVSQAAKLDLDRGTLKNECFWNSTLMLILTWKIHGGPLCYPVLHHKKCWHRPLKSPDILPILSVCCCGFVHVKVCVRLPGSSLFRRAICLDNNDSWKVCHKSFFVEVGNQNSQTFRKFASAVPSSFHQKLVTFYADSSPWKKLLGTKTDGKISSVCPPRETTNFKKSSNPTAQEFRFGGRKTFKHQNYSGN